MPDNRHFLDIKFTFITTTGFVFLIFIPPQSDGRGESLVDYERGERREGKCLCCCDMEVYIEVEEAYGTLAELEWNVKMAKLSQPNFLKLICDCEAKSCEVVLMKAQVLLY